MKLENETSSSKEQPMNKSVYLITFGIAFAVAIIHELLRGYSYGSGYHDGIIWATALGHAIPAWGLSLIGTLKRKQKLKGWLTVFCILEVLYSIGAYDLLSEEKTQSTVSTSQGSSGQVVMKTIPENPHMFVSDEYEFGIIFPNGDPDKIQGEGMGAQGVRYQFLDETVKNPVVYSVTAIRGPGVPEGLKAGHVLSSSADMWLKLDKAESYKETKKFMKWGTYDVLFFDSHYNEDENRFPKRSMLLMRESDNVMFTLSVVSGVRTGLDQKLQDFASSLVLMKR